MNTKSRAPFCYPFPHPAVTVDMVVFTVREAALQLLLIKRGAMPFKDCWTLPGGFVQIDEGLAQAAERELAEETGLAGIYLEQLHTFGDPGRDPRERVISVAYVALVPSDRLSPKAGSDAAEAAWHGVSQLPRLAFDHGDIIALARSRLAAKLGYSTIALQFMPRRFTLSELQSIYEIVAGEPFDKRNFRKWILGLDILAETGERRIEGAHRPAMLYEAKDRNRIDVIR